MLTSQDAIRYERNIMVPEIGTTGQERLKASRVMVVGAGGLGSPVLLYLAAAGVGEIVVYDGDAVALSNLQRQVIHSEESLGVNKARSAKITLQKLNPNTSLEIHEEHFCSKHDHGRLDCVIVCADNIASRLEINRWAAGYKIPVFHAGVKEWFGHVFTYLPGKGPCYQCLFDAEEILPPEIGVVGPVAGVLGCLQAIEAIKYLIGSKELLSGKILFCDFLKMEFDTIDVVRNPACQVCGD